MSPTYGQPNGPKDDDDWDALIRRWSLEDLREGDNAAEFLAMLICVKNKAATSANIADVYDAAQSTNLLLGFSDFTRRIMDAVLIVMDKAATQQLEKETK